MRTSQTFPRYASSKNIFLSFGFLLLLSLATGAQTTTTSHSDIATPGGLAAGSPTGAYKLSGFENVNLYNGNLDFHLPLIAIGGRGSAAFPITLSLNTKRWHVEHTQTQSSEGWYASRAYWGTLPGYSAGVMQGRRTGFGIKNTAGCSGLNKQIYQTTLTTLTFTGPDGTEYEFRDQLNGGQRMTVTTPCPTIPYTGALRGTVWVTADGSAATFISDAVIYDLVDVPTYHRNMTGITGYLLLRDGTKYRIEGGGVSWIRDRNGNMIYNNTDALGRQFAIMVVGEGATYEDQISYKGFGGAARVIRITHDLLQNALRPGFSIRTPAQLFPELPSGTNFPPFNPAVVTSVILPNGQSYQFKYNDYGELTRVVLPTGGAIEYDMNPGSGVVYGNNGEGDDYEIYRRVVERRTYKDGSATPVTRTVYVAPADGAGPVEVKHYDGTNGVLTTLVAVEKHYFATNRIESLIPQLDGSGFPIQTYPSCFEGKETAVESYATDGTNATTLLRRTVTNWQAGATLGGFSVNPRIADTTTTLSDTNQVSKQVFAYDQCAGCNSYFNNQTDVYEYDYGSGAPASQWTRRTHTDYVTATSYIDATTGAHLRSLLSQVSVFDGGGVERSRSSFEYDNYSTDANHAALVNRANIINLDSTFTTSYLTRGNVTATTGYLLNNGTVTGSITSYAQYDIAGNVVKAVDGRGYATLIDFSDRFGAPDGHARANSGSAELNAAGKYSYAFATFVSNALGHTAYAQFDYYLGQPVDGEDANGIVASGFYNDALDRPTQVIRANNQLVSLKSQTTFGYDDTNRIITTSSDQDSFNDPTPLKSQIVYDGLGRTTEKRQFENASDYIALLQAYDGLGRSKQTSNPYRPFNPLESLQWTITGYDALGRVTSVTTPDSAAVSTSYSGNTVTVTDQAGKQRKSVTDALGRLVQVYEDPAGLNYQTSYSYSVLDNLTTVNQGAQTRTFVYDSLKRLTSASNPESGTVTYQYDNNSNLTVKTDARGVSSTYTYDALNRNTSIIYSDGTPRVNRYYDSSVRGIGRLTWEETVNVFAKVVDIYDVMGQPVQYRQRFWVSNDWGDHFWGFASYDKAGHVTSMTYPSGRTVTNSFDGAGRQASLAGSLGDNSQRTYSTGVTYSSFGGMTQEQFGTTTPIYNKRHYNIRGQLYDVRASTFSLAGDEFNWNRGCIALYYGGAAWGQSSTTNNGNTTIQQHFVPVDDAISNYSFTQQYYAYDTLNRLSSVSEVHGGPWGQSSQDYAQAYSYDRYGNRIIDQGGTWGANIPKPTYNITTSDNRLTAPAGYTYGYDQAGNLINDTYTGEGAREFNAENRMKRAWANGQWQTYTYDGSGMRIKRTVNGVETWQVYGLGGELIAEYSATMSPANPQKEYGYRNGELLMTADAPSTTNLALNKSATQSTDPGWGGPASDAVDNNTSGNWSDGSVTHTNYDNLAWWQVDLGGTYTINSVQVWNRTDCCAERLTNFNVTLLDANQAVVASANYPAQAGSATTITITGTGRYVKVQLAGTNYLSLAEVKVWGAPAPSSAQLRWLVTDQLGTPRMVLDQTGSLANMSRHDYLPFGEEVPGNFRTGIPGYGTGDNVRQKFTQKERDNETGLDYFGERFYASLQGRFTTVDPLMASATTHDPQSFNRYTFVLNNPLRYIDPDGMKPRNPWDQLTAEEKKIITPKLTISKGQTARQVFNNLATVKDAKGRVDRQATQDKITTIKNFIDSAGGHGNSEVWQQVKTINSIDLGRNASDPSKTEGRVTVTVVNKDKFLEVAGRNGYDVNRYYEVFADHPNDSARQITRTSFEPGLHFANDDSSNLSKFYAHWDRRSSAFQETNSQYWTRQGEQIDAGYTHNNPYTPSQLRQELKKNGTVPRGEP